MEEAALRGCFQGMAFQGDSGSAAGSSLELHEPVERAEITFRQPLNERGRVLGARARGGTHGRGALGGVLGVGRADRDAEVSTPAPSPFAPRPLHPASLFQACGCHDSKMTDRRERGLDEDLGVGRGALLLPAWPTSR